MKKLLLVLTFFLWASPAYAAITLGNTMTMNNSSLSYTFDSGSQTNGALIACVTTGGVGETINSATYNSVSMTLVGVASGVSGVGPSAIFVLANPATGSHTFTANITGGSAVAGGLVSYSGVNQTSPIETHALQNAITESSPLSFPLTTTIANDWLVACADSTAFVLVAGSGTTGRDANGDTFDSNGGLAAGSNNLQVTWTGTTQPVNWVVAALEPFVPVIESTATRTVFFGVRAIFQGVKVVLF